MRVIWAAVANPLSSKDKQMKSPQFLVDVPGLGMQPFKISLFPFIPVADVPGKQQKGTACFKKAKGRGRAELKCEAALDNVPKLSVQFGIGDQEASDWVIHDFGVQSTCSLGKLGEIWDFKSAVKTDDKNVFTVYALIRVAQESALGMLRKG